MAQKQIERLPFPSSETTFACPLLYAPPNSYGLGPFEVLVQIPIQLENTVCVSLRRRRTQAPLTGGQPLPTSRGRGQQDGLGMDAQGRVSCGQVRQPTEGLAVLTCFHSHK